EGDAESDPTEGRSNSLKVATFRVVSHLAIFVVDNQTGGPRTQITQLAVLGSPIGETNLSKLQQRQPRRRRQNQKNSLQPSLLTEEDKKVLASADEEILQSALSGI